MEYIFIPTNLQLLSDSFPLVVIMSNTYNVDSESDDEEDEETEIAAPIAKNSTWHLQDIEKAWIWHSCL